MSAWFFEAGICIALVLMAWACFQHDSNWVRRVGGWLLVAAWGAGLWFVAGEPLLVLLGVIAWFAVPVGQAAYVSRRLRFSADRKLERADVDVEEFPEVRPISQQLRDLGFSQLEDYVLNPSPMDQRYRLFRNGSHFAAVATAQQGDAALSYLMFFTPDQEETAWMTWDYPLAYGLKIPPSLMVYRCLDALSVEEMWEQHQAFLEINEVTSAEECDGSTFLEEVLGKTLKYNLNIGVLELRGGGEAGEVSYSWRGTLFLSMQVLRELVLG